MFILRGNFIFVGNHITAILVWHIVLCVGLDRSTGFIVFTFGISIEGGELGVAYFSQDITVMGIDLFHST